MSDFIDKFIKELDASIESRMANPMSFTEAMGRVMARLDRPIDKLLIVDADVVFDLTTPEVIAAQRGARCDILILAPFRAYSGWLAEAQTRLVNQGMHLDRLHLLCFKRDESVESRLMRLYMWLERWAVRATTLSISRRDTLNRAGIRVLDWGKALEMPDRVEYLIRKCLSDPRYLPIWRTPSVSVGAVAHDVTLQILDEHCNPTRRPVRVEDLQIPVAIPGLTDAFAGTMSKVAGKLDWEQIISDARGPLVSAMGLPPGAIARDDEPEEVWMEDGSGEDGSGEDGES